MTKAQILIVEDETKLARLLSNFLSAENYICHHLARGDLVIDWLTKHPVDLVLLDVMLPGCDGMSLCQQLRRHPTLARLPVIMLTARVEELDQLQGLALGADDYITKPFSLKNVAARVAALLRRAQMQTQTQLQTQMQMQTETSTSTRAVTLESGGNKLVIYGQAIELTATEYRLVRVLYDHPGRIFSRSQLLDKAHDDFKAVTERSVDSHIKSIRRKITDLLPERDLIHAIYGMGYKWEE